MTFADDTPSATSAPEGAGAGGRRRRHGRRRSPISTALTWALVAAAAVGGGLAGCHPTGQRVLDVIYTALFAALVTAAASRARRWTLLWFAFVGVAMSRGWLLAPAGVALLGAFAACWPRHQRRAIGAAVGALAIQVVLRWPTHPLDKHIGFQGLTALVAAAAVAPTLLSAYRHSRRHVRRRIRWITGAVVLVGVVLAVPLAVAALISRSTIDRGVADTRGALSIAITGNTSGAVDHLGVATTDFASANHRVGAWWTEGARLIPVEAQQRQALTTAVSTAHTLTGSVKSQVGKFNLHGLEVHRGKLDVARLTQLATPLSAIDGEVNTALHTLGGTRSKWVAPPISHRLDSLTADLQRARNADGLAVEALHDAPGLLGEDGVRRYFVAFINPAESRGLGGLLGGYGLLTIDNGHIKLTRSGHVSALDLPRYDHRKITGPADYLARYGEFDPQKYFQDLPYSPDFPTDAQVIGQMYPQSGGVHVDGVLAIDPTALADLLKVTGPIRVAGAPYALTKTNVAPFLLRTQYSLFAPKGGVSTNKQRYDFLEEALVKAFHDLTTGSLPNPIRLARSLGPAVAGGHLLFWSFHHSEQPLLRDSGLAGAFPRADGQDLLSVVTQNVANNKIDAYLERSVSDHVTYDPSTGAASETVTIKLHNTAPSSGLPSYVISSYRGSGLGSGTNETWLSLYSPLALDGVTQDGQKSGLEPGSELGVSVYSRYVDIPAKSTVTLVVHLTGTLKTGSDYTLHLHQQPMAIPDHDQVTVTGTPGWRVSGSDTWTPSSKLTQSVSMHLKHSA